MYTTLIFDFLKIAKNIKNALKTCEIVIIIIIVKITERMKINNNGTSVCPY